MQPSTEMVPVSARLVADDQIQVERRDGELYLKAPEPIRGLLEVRGLGILNVPLVEEEAQLTLVVDLVAPTLVERLPDPPACDTLLGVSVPVLKIAPFTASAPLKLLLALHALNSNKKSPAH
jgi:serine kinase of HPr protein (carbohydrate metabolism regulator)